MDDIDNIDSEMEFLQFCPGDDDLENLNANEADDYRNEGEGMNEDESGIELEVDTPLGEQYGGE